MQRPRHRAVAHPGAAAHPERRAVRRAAGRPGGADLQQGHHPVPRGGHRLHQLLPARGQALPAQERQDGGRPAGRQRAGALPGGPHAAAPDGRARRHPGAPGAPGQPPGERTAVARRTHRLSGGRAGGGRCRRLDEPAAAVARPAATAGGQHPAHHDERRAGGGAGGRPHHPPGRCGRLLLHAHPGPGGGAARGAPRQAGGAGAPGAGRRLRRGGAALRLAAQLLGHHAQRRPGAAALQGTLPGAGAEPPRQPHRLRRGGAPGGAGRGLGGPARPRGSRARSPARQHQPAHRDPALPAREPGSRTPLCPLQQQRRARRGGRLPDDRAGLRRLHPRGRPQRPAPGGAGSAPARGGGPRGDAGRRTRRASGRTPAGAGDPGHGAAAAPACRADRAAPDGAAEARLPARPARHHREHPGAVARQGRGKARPAAGTRPCARGGRGAGRAHHRAGGGAGRPRRTCRRRRGAAGTAGEAHRPPGIGTGRRARAGRGRR